MTQKAARQTGSTLLKRNDIQIDPSSYVDPQGFVFIHNGSFHRCIREEALPLFRKLLDSRVLDHLEQNFALVPSVPTDLRLEGDEAGMIVTHPRIEPLSFCSEWCQGMLWEAARVTLDLAIDIAEQDLILQDAYPWNVLFDGAECVFVDLTSIARPDPVALWPAHEQYESYFTRPLVLMNEGKGNAVRALLTNNIQGIDLETFTTLQSARTMFRHPGAGIARAIEKRLQSNIALKAKARELARKSAANTSPQVRKKFLQRLRNRLTPLRRVPQGDCWTNYYDEINPDFDKQAKLRIVGELLDRHGGKTVLDLGCNTGVFSLEAAKRGARVFSVDSSESVVDLLYETVRSQNLPITPLISDIACPTATGGFMGTQYPLLFDRVRADTVLCLGLMHHLHINARQSFERIAELVAHVCGSTLIFEFISINDDNVSLLSELRKIDYDLDKVRSALSVHFSSIETHDSDRSTRKLLLCRK